MREVVLAHFTCISIIVGPRIQQSDRMYSFAKGTKFVRFKEDENLCEVSFIPCLVTCVIMNAKP